MISLPHDVCRCIGVDYVAESVCKIRGECARFVHRVDGEAAAPAYIPHSSWVCSPGGHDAFIPVATE